MILCLTKPKSRKSVIVRAKSRIILPTFYQIGFFELERKIIIMLSNDRLTKVQVRALEHSLDDLHSIKYSIAEIQQQIHEMFNNTCNVELMKV
ncbi:MAG: hypothetical protein K9W44_16360 [Candidatus Lokiarchaeota archaeon]|nr:hypothetical protein [Candidatus Harpocratesius repetitus]